MRVTVELPRLGETVEEVVVLDWLVAEGEAVQRDQPLVEVETDKLQTDVPSPVEGTVARIVAAVGDELGTGAPLCEIEVDG
ncbi:MAG TPA: biotin/lipoyl-containing protein [Capillimicrobium sp.]|nr:biotin/lipoyl-containing protein [Capillimicrobium sp.]